jgi:predicted Zn finger-like uncharacterized protein
MPVVHCPNCDAVYHVVKAEVGPETVDQRITCRVCDGPFPSREKDLILKYFLLRESGHHARRSRKTKPVSAMSESGQ